MKHRQTALVPSYYDGCDARGPKHAEYCPDKGRRGLITSVLNGNNVAESRDKNIFIHIHLHSISNICSIHIQSMAYLKELNWVRQHTEACNSVIYSMFEDRQIVNWHRYKNKPSSTENSSSPLRRRAEENDFILHFRRDVSHRDPWRAISKILFMRGRNIINDLRHLFSPSSPNTVDWMKK